MIKGDVFQYPDTNSTRAEIDNLNSRFHGLKIAIIGIGGTGANILDHISKTSVAEIHLYDGNIFQIQVTYFYSMKKNTFEMIKLLDVLINQYNDQETLYLCWDAISWHNSKILKYYIEEHNKIRKPLIKLAPLPACTQFLNVIESVFGDLAKAIIHNSDYASVDECKKAIDLHFAFRNQHFKDHPNRAGRKIWGKEIVKAKFSETHNCRNRNAIKGAQ